MKSIQIKHPSTIQASQKAFVDHAVSSLSADRRIAGIAAAGSYADDSMDEFSDVDLIIAVEAEHHAEVMGERLEIASRLGNLLVAFTGEHVGEPRVLISLYASPLLHADLKFVALPDLARRVDEPVVVWERDERLSRILAASAGSYPCPEFQWVEDRFWVWVHYAATKIGRGEFFEALDFLSFLRGKVLAPLGLRELGMRPSGVRKIEMVAPSLSRELEDTIGGHDRNSLLLALQACIAIYRRLRSAEAHNVASRSDAEDAAVEFLRELTVIDFS